MAVALFVNSPSNWHIAYNIYTFYFLSLFTLWKLITNAINCDKLLLECRVRGLLANCVFYDMVHTMFNMG